MKKSLRIGLSTLCLIAIAFYGVWLVTGDTPIVTKSNQPAAVLGVSATTECPYTIASWNIGNLGKSKNQDSFDIMAKTLKSKNVDLVAIQEVTARNKFGAQAVAKLASALSDTGEEWDYVVSDATLPASLEVERYAFLFKKSKVSVNRDNPQLLVELQDPIEREPYYGTFSFKSNALQQNFDVTMFSIHTVPTEKGPKREVEALLTSSVLHELAASTRKGVFAGDFNLGPNATDHIFANLGFKGYINQKTSLKKTVTDGGQYLLNQYDNVYAKNIHVCGSGVIDFVQERFSPVTSKSLLQARGVSDHLPVYINFGP